VKWLKSVILTKRRSCAINWVKSARNSRLIWRRKRNGCEVGKAERKMARTMVCFSSSPAWP